LGAEKSRKAEVVAKWWSAGSEVGAEVVGRLFRWRACCREKWKAVEWEDVPSTDKYSSDAADTAAVGAGYLVH
jgi:hypothetical protein